MIDVHILTHPTQDRSATLDPLLRSLDREPVNVHLVPGVYRMIGAGRAKGFRCGNEGLVSFVDDDDEIVPGVFDKLLEIFEKDPEIDGACTREQAFINGEPVRTWAAQEFPWKYYDRRHYLNIHHVVAYKRDKIDPYLDSLIDVPTSSEHTLAGLMLLNGAIIRHAPFIGYKWHQHGGSTPSLAMAMHPKTEQLHRDIMALCQSEGYVSHVKKQGYIR